MHVYLNHQHAHGTRSCSPRLICSWPCSAAVPRAARSALHDTALGTETLPWASCNQSRQAAAARHCVRVTASRSATLGRQALVMRLRGTRGSVALSALIVGAAPACRTHHRHGDGCQLAGWSAHW